MNLFLVPASHENIRKTIIGSVSISTASQLLPLDQMNTLKEPLNGNGSFKCWAMTESKRSTYAAMRRDDLVLLTPKDTGKFKYIGKVIHKFENEGLGNHLWDFTPGKPWKLIYVLDEIEEIDINKSKLVKELGYAPNYAVPGAIKVNKDQLNKALYKHKNINSLIESLKK